MLAFPYDEDVITNLITQVFDFHLQLCYFAQEDIIYPPPPDSEDTNARPRHAFPSETYKEFSDLRLSGRVISLLERIPYLRPDKDSRAYPVYEYGCELISPVGLNMDYSRNPAGVETDHPLLPSDVALVTMGVNDGRTLILDTEENTIRLYSRYSNDPQIPEDPTDPRWQDFEYPNIPDHYRNWAAEPAPAFIQRWMNGIKGLDPIGWFESEASFEGELMFAPEGFDAEREITDEELEVMPLGGTYDERVGECCEKRYKFLKRTLQRDYGWPDNFQAERWAADHWDVWRQAKERYDSMDGTWPAPRLGPRSQT